MPLIVFTTVVPFFLLLQGIVSGGPWIWAALGFITLFTFVMDRVFQVSAPNQSPPAANSASEALLILLSVLHFTLLGLSIWGIAGPSALTIIERVGVAVTAALVFGQISHPVAHELIHRGSRAKQRLGGWIYISMLFGHHKSAHLRVHHPSVGSDGDPNSARRGEGFWRYLLRAWPAGFWAAFEAETTLRDRAKSNSVPHPFTVYTLGGLLTCFAAIAAAGPAGLATLLFLSLYMQLQVFLSDYVQHYGLRRAVLPNGRLEPVSAHHSWNAPHLISAAMTLNAPWHSDHHTSPGRSYPTLRLSATKVPMLPYSLPVMATIALFPPLWRKIMDPLCRKWQAPPPKPATNRLQVRLNDRFVSGLPNQDLPHSSHVESDTPSISDPEPARKGQRIDERGTV